MTKEQEAIKRLNRFKTIKILYGNTFAMHIEQLKTVQEDIETVLSMLKENSAEIEQKNTELAEKNVEIEKKDKRLNRQFKLLIKKDKIIYEMAKAFRQDDVRSVEEIIKYFERKSEE